MPCRFLDLFSHVVITVEVEDVCDKVEGILIVLNFRVQTGEVEAIGEIFLVDLTEVFISS